MAMNAYLYCWADSSRWRGVDARDQNPDSRELEDCLGRRLDGLLKGGGGARAVKGLRPSRHSQARSAQRAARSSWQALSMSDLLLLSPSGSSLY